MQPLILQFISAIILLSPLGLSAESVESFEKFKEGELTRCKTALGVWSAARGNSEIHRGNAKSGTLCLRLTGGKKKRLSLALPEPTQGPSMLTFWAERWTARGPFEFTVEARTHKGWREVYNGANEVKTKNFPTHVKTSLPPGTGEVRFGSTTPEDSGVLIDEVSIAAAKPMRIEGVTTVQPVLPVLIRKKTNPVVALKMTTQGQLKQQSVTAIEIDLAGTTRVKDVKSIQIIHGDSLLKPGVGKVYATEQTVSGNTADTFVFRGNAKLLPGENYFWVCVELHDSASLDHQVDASVRRVALGGKKTLVPEIESPEGAQRIGYAVRQQGDDGSKAFRIPGLATTNKGTLIGVYDVRYRSGGDLPGDIDVGMSRSTDGGQTWEKMKIIMDMGNDPKWNYDGIGDPAILVDKSNNRIWVGATWSHGNRSWHGSGQGMKPEETGQVMLVYSDDDGLTWSKPINITSQVKTNPDWHFVLHGPGAGITMKDGTLVFAAQYQDESKHPNGKKRAYPFSTIMWSKDHGKTWHLGTGIKGNTTEAQVVELSDGSLMLNCRDNRGGYRTVGVTKDLGKTWTMHPTDRKALQDPVCMASLLRVDHQKHGTLFFFSNPNTQRGRHNMTIKVSRDEGMSWPEQYHTLYDSRSCSGYSCLTPVGKDHIGVYYEGPTEIYYLRFKIAGLLK
ncbi:MAG: exo-alpha-sialidase [Akkermansiaceae bacterium]|nr:exo-alpha-sialidase [Akkermansiaceae bacterium]